MSVRPTVVIGEQSMLLRAALLRLLDQSGFAVLAACAGGESLQQAVAIHCPDLVVVAARLPPTFTDEGIQLALRVRRDDPGRAVMVLGHQVDDRYAGELIADGAKGIGYLLTDRMADVPGFVEALRQVLGGGTVFDPELAGGRSNMAVNQVTIVGAGAVQKHLPATFAELELPPTGHHLRRVLAVLSSLDHDAQLMDS